MPLDFLEFLDPALVPFLGTFLFMFAVVFGLLTYSKILGFSKHVNGIIAVVFGLFAASFEPLREGLLIFIPIASVFLAIIFVLVFIQKIFEQKEDKSFDALPPVLILSISLLLLAAFWDQMNIALGIWSSSDILWIIGILLVVGIFTLIYYHKPGRASPP